MRCSSQFKLWLELACVLLQNKGLNLGCWNNNMKIFKFLTLSTLIFTGLIEAGNNPVNYDIVYVRQVRFGDNINTTWPEVFHPARMDTGADLMLLHPDGTEEILVDCNVCSVTDPFVSFDAQWVYYSLFHDLTQLNSQRGDLPLLGADIFRINLSSREIEQLTNGQFTPNTGNGNWDENNPLNPSSEFNRLGYGILNLSPMPLPDNKLVFTSNRNGYVPTKGFTNPTLQLFVMDVDGSNIHAIAPMTIGSALHPTILNDGRIMFSSYESQGIRDRRVWGIWTINPDGTNWAPLVSAMTSPNAYHFSTQISSGEIVIEQYYNLNNNGFGSLYALPASPDSSMPPFGSPFPSLNTPIDTTRSFGPTTFKDSFTPQGYYAITPMTHANDNAAPLFTIGGDPNGPRVGKFTQPSAAPENDLLVVWTPGPANDLNRPTTFPYYDAGLYVIDNSVPVWDPNELILIKNDPNYNEAWPRAVVSWQDIHGSPEPAKKTWLANDGTIHAQLPAGTPYGLVGTSSFYKRDSFPGVGKDNFDGLDPFNTSQNGASSNWSYQGADAGKYSNSDIWAVRLLAMEPITDRRYGPNNSPSNHAGDFISHANEKLRILGEIPLRKFDQAGNPIMDIEGNPDTSFLAKIPANTPFTFQTIDRNGMVLNASQTWHQVRPGEMRVDCGGCHAHSQMPLDFATTQAANINYQVVDLSTSTPLISKDLTGNNDIEDVQQPLVDVEFYQDIRPILQTYCVSCHNSTQQAGQLILDDISIVSDNKPGDYLRLASDSDASFGYQPVISNKKWRQTNASRYIRQFQSRRSLLIWKIFGERLDGWSNDDHPTETVPGDENTLPAGANANDADLDFNASAAHPAGGMASLSMKQKMTMARWIDLGAPLDISVTTGTGLGWFIDDVKPTITISAPRQNLNTSLIDKIIFGLADANTGIDIATLSVKADFTVNGQAPNTELSAIVSTTGDGIYQIQLDQELPQNSIERHIFIEVKDNQGNVKRVDLRFVSSDLIFSDGFD
jgi:hypothetical protein